MSGSPDRRLRRLHLRRGHDRVKTFGGRRYCTSCRTWLDPEPEPPEEDTP